MYHLQERENTPGYNHVTEVERAFLDGNIGSMPQNITVQGIEYRYLESTDHSWEQILKNSRKAMSAYSVHPNKENIDRFNKHKAETAEDVNSPQQLLVMLWGVTRKLSVVPASVRFITRGRQMQTGIRGVSEGTELGYEDQIVINNINDNQPIECKIDTGADMCSLHADNIQMADGTVSFVVNGRNYRMPLAGTQHIKQAEGQEERPTVLFDFQLGGETITGIECNLNDRSGMCPMLVGKNLLSKGEFTINTQITEGMDIETLSEEEWNDIAAVFEDVEIPEPTVTNVSVDEVERVLNFMLESNCSMKDVIHHIKQDTMKVLSEDITY